MTDETRLEFAQQADDKDDFIIAIHSGENENNTAQRIAPEVLLQQQQGDATMRVPQRSKITASSCGAHSKSCVAAAAIPHENIHSAQLISATTAAVTPAQSAQSRLETVPQSGGTSEKPRQLSAHTPIDED